LVLVTGTELGQYLHREIKLRMGATITPQHGKLLDPSFGNGEFLFRPIRPDGRPQALVPAVARPRLTSTMLSQSLKLQIDPRVVNRMPSGHFIRAHELWLDLPSSILENIRSVEYHFYHPTFRSPKRPEPGANNFFGSVDGLWLHR
jgi:hypothetical protein